MCQNIRHRLYRGSAQELVLEDYGPVFPEYGNDTLMLSLFAEYYTRDITLSSDL